MVMMMMKMVEEDGVNIYEDQQIKRQLIFLA